MKPLRPLMLFAIDLKIVPGILVCSSILISVCMFIVSKALLISSATMIVRAGGATVEVLLCQSLMEIFS